MYREPARFCPLAQRLELRFQPSEHLREQYGRLPRDRATVLVQFGAQAADGAAKTRQLLAVVNFYLNEAAQPLPGRFELVQPIEHGIFRSPFFDGFYTAEKEHLRQQVNAWIRGSGEFDGVIDFDESVRDPDHPTQLLPAYDSGDHLHVNDAGNVAQGNAIPLVLFHNH